MLASALWAPSGRWINLFQGTNELLISLFCIWKHRHKGPGSTQSKTSTMPDKEMGQVAPSPWYHSIPFFSIPLHPFLLLGISPCKLLLPYESHKTFHSRFKMAGNSSECRLAQGNLSLCRDWRLQQKEQKLKHNFPMCFGQRSHCLWNNCFRLLPTLKTHKAD